MRRADRQLLRELGWPGRPADVAEFQRGYALSPPLVVDGRLGPRTRAALQLAVDRGRRGLPNASAHFGWGEFRCRCGGQLAGCAVQRVHRGLLLALEDYRAAAGGPVQIVSGYRCPERNRLVGGAASSQHLLGAAADVKAALTVPRVRRLRRFGGIGYRAKGGLVAHVDVRHLAGRNTTNGTPDRPTTWRYG